MPHRGTVLVVVLIVVVMLSLAALTFSKLMFAERKGADYSLRQRQVRLLAESGVESLRITLMKEPSVLSELGELYDNEELFRGYIVTDGTIAMIGARAGLDSGARRQIDYRDLGRFSVVAPALSEDGSLLGESIRYGLEDESTKINLRWIMQTETQMPGYGRTFLLRLPGMTEEIADAILDWLDEDMEVREYGAEDDYYAALDPPYYPRNGIPDSLDELLLVKGVTPTLLYGVDWNRNGLLDVGEPDEAVLDDYGSVDGSLHLGLISYLTLDSRESIIDSESGETKINLNMSDTTALREQLTERLEETTWVDYIIRYREANEKINSIFALVGGSVGEGDSAVQSPFSEDAEAMNDYLPVLYDNLTTSDKPIVGRININQAPRASLMVLVDAYDELSSGDAAAAGTGNSVSSAGSSVNQARAAAEEAGVDTSAVQSSGTTSADPVPMEEIIEGILAARIVNPADRANNPEMQYPYWPYVHGIIADLATFKKIEPYICTQGAVFRAQVIGRFDEQSPVARLEVWLDATDPLKPAKIIRFRELSDLGPGYSGSQLGVETLTTGRGAIGSR